MTKKMMMYDDLIIIYPILNPVNSFPLLYLGENVLCDLSNDWELLLLGKKEKFLSPRVSDLAIDSYFPSPSH